MLKRKRKINKQVLIATSRYKGPLPMAYAALIAGGTAPGLAKDMIEEIWLCGSYVRDMGNLAGICMWDHTSYEVHWRKAAGRWWE